MKKAFFILLALLLPLSACSSRGREEEQAFPLEGKTVCVVKGAAAAKLAPEFLAAEIIECGDAEEAVALLGAGKADALVYDTSPARRLSLVYDDLSVLPAQPAPPRELVCAVKRENYDMLGLVNTVFAEADDNGTLDSLLAVFINTPENQRAKLISEPQTGENGVLTLATTADNPPFSYRGANGAVAGLDIELAKLIARKDGKTLEVKVIRAAEAFAVLNDGTADFYMAGLTEEAAASRYTDVSDVYYKSTQVIVVCGKIQGETK